MYFCCGFCSRENLLTYFISVGFAVKDSGKAQTSVVAGVFSTARVLFKSSACGRRNFGFAVISPLKHSLRQPAPATINANGKLSD